MVRSSLSTVWRREDIGSPANTHTPLGVNFGFISRPAINNDNTKWWAQKKEYNICNVSFCFVFKTDSCLYLLAYGGVYSK